MAVKIRLKRMGNKNRPFFRLMVADSRSPRDGRFLEILGHYDPIKDPEVLEINREKTLKWLQNGAQVSETARSLLKKKGIIQEFQAMKAGVEYVPPVVEEPVQAVEEPKVEEPVVAEPVVEEPAAEEAPVEETAVEEAAVEETTEAVEEEAPQAEETAEETEEKSE